MGQYVETARVSSGLTKTEKTGKTWQFGFSLLNAENLPWSGW